MPKKLNCGVFEDFLNGREVQILKLLNLYQQLAAPVLHLKCLENLRGLDLHIRNIFFNYVPLYITMQLLTLFYMHVMSMNTHNLQRKLYIYSLIKNETSSRACSDYN